MQTYCIGLIVCVCVCVAICFGGMQSHSKRQFVSFFVVASTDRYRDIGRVESKFQSTDIRGQVRGWWSIWLLEYSYIASIVVYQMRATLHTFRATSSRPDDAVDDNELGLFLITRTRRRYARELVQLRPRCARLRGSVNNTWIRTHTVTHAHAHRLGPETAPRERCNVYNYHTCTCSCLHACVYKHIVDAPARTYADTAAAATASSPTTSQPASQLSACDDKNTRQIPEIGHGHTCVFNGKTATVCIKAESECSTLLGQPRICQQQH